MVEYLYNAIRASAGSDAVIGAHIRNTSGECIKENCSLMLHDDNDMLGTFEGALDGSECWTFTIPAEITKDLKGRYWYCICHQGVNLCFKEPIYFI